MSKSELIEKVVAASEISKKQAMAAVDAVFETIAEVYTKGDKLNIIGFGTFEVRERAARIGRNPQTGEEIKIDACKVPAFKPSKVLKEKINK